MVRDSRVTRSVAEENGGVPPPQPGTMRKVIRHAVAVLDTFDRFVLVPVCVLSILALAIVVAGDAVVRYAYKSSLPHVDEIVSQLLMPMIVFLALSFVGAVRGHVAVDMLFERLNGAKRRIVTALFDLLAGALLFGIASEYFTQLKGSSFATSPTVLIPDAYAFCIVVIGCLVGTARMAVSACAELTLTPRTSLKNAREVIDEAS